MGYRYDEGFRRMVQFNIMVLPIFLHYKFVQFRTRGLSDAKVSAAYRPLHEYYAPRVLEICQGMQGFYIKLGQMAAGASDAIVDVYVEALKPLLDHCPAQPFEVVRTIVERELGALEDIFESFEEVPINAASIGQVHAAQLHGGHRVVVKVQYPNAERHFRIDMKCFMRAVSVFIPEQLRLLEEMERNFVNEFDYTREAALQRRAAEYVAPLRHVVVPWPVDSSHPATPQAAGLCTKNVLVMDRLDGQNLPEWSRAALTELAERRGQSREELLHELRRMPPEEIERLRPSRLALRAAAWAMLARDLLANTPAFVYNWSWGWFKAMPTGYAWTRPPVDLYHVANTLLDSQGYLLFEAGFVNGDPHPGNLMLLDDGRLGLIDWGQVKELSAEERCLGARIFVTVADGDEPQTAQYMRELGMRTKRDLDWTLNKLAGFYFNSWHAKSVRELGGPMTFEENLNKVDKVQELVGWAVMVIRNQIMIRQACSLLGFPLVSTAERYRGDAVHCLQRYGWDVPRTMRRSSPEPCNYERILAQNGLLKL